MHCSLSEYRGAILVVVNNERGTGGSLCGGGGCGARAGGLATLPRQERVSSRQQREPSLHLQRFYSLRLIHNVRPSALHILGKEATSTSGCIAAVAAAGRFSTLVLRQMR